MLKEFREFAVRGNALDMAVGIILGAAFGAIVSSLVDDVIMPPIGFVLGGVDFSDLFVVLREGATAGPYTTIEQAKAAGAVTWNLGMLINAVIKFVIVAFAVFLLVQAFNRLRRKQDVAPAEAPPPPRQEMLLEEIRDLLKRDRLGGPGV